jgi:hypothetical protein
MKRKIWFLSIVAGIGVSGALIVGQIRDAAVLAQVSQLTAQMAQPSPDTRIEAFYHLIEMGSGTDPTARVGPATLALLKDFPEKSDEIQVTFTRTLETENGVVKASPSLNEDYTNYYGDLVTAVVSFNDARSVKALSDAVGTGNMVIRRLAGFGQAALEPVLAQLSADPNTRLPRDPISKQGASVVLGLLLDPSNPAGIKDPATRSRIKDALKAAAKDAAGAYIRTAAVEALSKIDDVDVVAFLTDVAGKDGFQATAGKPTTFPVREAAALALAKVGQRNENAAAKPALDALTKLGSQGSSPAARTAAAQALTHLAGDSEATPAPVRSAARDALLRLGFGTLKKPDPAAAPEQAPAAQPTTTPPQSR